MHCGCLCWLQGVGCCKVLDQKPQFNVISELHTLTKLLGIVYKQRRDLRYVDAGEALYSCHFRDFHYFLCVVDKLNELYCDEQYGAENTYMLQAKWVLKRYSKQVFVKTFSLTLQLHAGPLICGLVQSTESALNGTIFDAVAELTETFYSASKEAFLLTLRPGKHLVEAAKEVDFKKIGEK